MSVTTAKDYSTLDPGTIIATDQRGSAEYQLLAPAGLDISHSLQSGISVVHKFGQAQVSATLVPITTALVYQMPTAAVTLEVISDDAADTTDGVGAQAITIQGLDANFAEVTEEIELAGTSASAASANTYLRLYRAYVSRAGRYATAAVMTQAGTLTVRVESAGATWMTLGEIATNQGVGQSQVACYTIPAGFTGYVRGWFVTIDSNKTPDIYFFKRDNADDVAAPFTGAMRLQQQVIGATGSMAFSPSTPLGPYAAKTDLVWMGLVASNTADISIDFEIILVAD